MSLPPPHLCDTHRFVDPKSALWLSLFREHAMGDMDNAAHLHPTLVLREHGVLAAVAAVGALGCFGAAGCFDAAGCFRFLEVATWHST